MLNYRTATDLLLHDYPEVSIIVSGYYGDQQRSTGVDQVAPPQDSAVSGRSSLRAAVTSMPLKAALRSSQVLCDTVQFTPAHTATSRIKPGLNTVPTILIDLSVG